jgi:hypothetical protein
MTTQQEADIINKLINKHECQFKNRQAASEVILEIYLAGRDQAIKQAIEIVENHLK